MKIKVNIEITDSINSLSDYSALGLTKKTLEAMWAETIENFLLENDDGGILKYTISAEAMD